MAVYKCRCPKPLCNFFYRDSDMRSVAGSTASADTIGLAGVDVCDMTEFDDEDLGMTTRVYFCHIKINR